MYLHVYIYVFFLPHNVTHEITSIVSSTTNCTHTQIEFIKEYGDPYPSTPYNTHSSNRLPTNLSKKVRHCSSLCIRDGLHPLPNELRDVPVGMISENVLETVK